MRGQEIPCLGIFGSHYNISVGSITSLDHGITTRMIQILKIFDLGLFLSIAEVSGFPEYQLLDARSYTVHILNAILGYNMA